MKVVVLGGEDLYVHEMTDKYKTICLWEELGVIKTLGVSRVFTPQNSVFGL